MLRRWSLAAMAAVIVCGAAPGEARGLGVFGPAPSRDIGNAEIVWREDGGARAGGIQVNRFDLVAKVRPVRRFEAGGVLDKAAYIDRFSDVLALVIQRSSDILINGNGRCPKANFSGRTKLRAILDAPFKAVRNRWGPTNIRDNGGQRDATERPVSVVQPNDQMGPLDGDECPYRPLCGDSGARGGLGCEAGEYDRHDQSYGASDPYKELRSSPPSLFDRRVCRLPFSAEIGIVGVLSGLATWLVAIGIDRLILQGRRRDGLACVGASVATAALLGCFIYP